MAIRLVTITGFSSCSGFELSNLSDVIARSNDFFTHGANCIDATPNSYIVNLDTLKIKRTASNFELYGVNGVSLGSTGYVSSDTFDFYGFAFAVDDDAELGSVVCCYHVNNAWYYCNCTSFSSWNTNAIYQAIIGAEQPLYTWRHVPAITGKGKTFNLGMIRNDSLGDGSPVTGATVSVVQNLPAESSMDSLLTTMGPSIGQKTILWSGDHKRMDAFILYAPPATMIITLKFYLQPGTGGVENLAYQYSYTIQGDWRNSYLGFIIDDEQEVACLSIIRTYKENQIEYVDYNTPGASMTSSEMHDLWLWLQGGGTDDGGDGIDNFTDNDPNGGGGSVQRYNNPIPKPGEPGLGGLETGFMSLWYMTSAQLQALSAYLWSDDFIDIINKRLYVDPKDAIVNLMILPYEPAHSGEASYISFMGKVVPKEGYRILDRWETIPMGRATIPRLLENGVYFDYPPFTSVKLWLPFCGEHELDVSDVMGKTLELEYLVDTLTGVCVANLNIKNPEAGDEVEGAHYYYSGQMGIKIPVSASDYSGLYNALISVGATALTAGALGMAGELTAPVQIGLVASASTNVANMVPKCQYSSGGGAIEGALSGEYPFLIISEPNVFEADEQRKYIGYPSFSTHTLSSCSGYTKVLDIHLDNIPCTESERESIKNLLTSGVIIQNGTPVTAEDVTPIHEGFSTVLFLKNLSDKNEFGKKFATTSGDLDALLLEGKLLFDQSIERPVMIINGNVSEYNYMYIPEFKRYYFISDIEYKAGGIQYVHGEVDPLQSFKAEILSNKAIISDTGETNKSKLLCNNNSWFMQQNKHVITVTFKDGYKRDCGFKRGSGSDESYVLTVAGG